MSILMETEGGKNTFWADAARKTRRLLINIVGSVDLRLRAAGKDWERYISSIPLFVLSPCMGQLVSHEREDCFHVLNYLFLRSRS